jgi:hypothetical protein
MVNVFNEAAMINNVLGGGDLLWLSLLDRKQFQ